MERPIGTDARSANGGFVDQLHGETWFHSFRRLPGPAAQQVPGSEAKMLGDQQPDAGQVPADLVGQQLAHPTLDAERVAQLELDPFTACPCLDVRR